MSIEEAVGLLLLCWITGYVLGFKIKQVFDALHAI